MRKALQKAIDAHDITGIRMILIDMASKPAGGISSINDITETIIDVPDLFEKDDGREYAPSPREMTEDLITSLRDDLYENFSLEKFRLLTEVREIERTNPKYFKNRTRTVKTEEFYPDGTLEITEHIVGDDIVTAEVVEMEAAGEPEQESKASGTVAATAARYRQFSQLFGYVIILLGVAAAIVGICVPVYFLIGVGIGVMMLGSALVYVMLERKPRAHVTA